MSSLQARCLRATLTVLLNVRATIPVSGQNSGAEPGLVSPVSRPAVCGATALVGDGPADAAGVLRHQFPRRRNEHEAAALVPVWVNGVAGQLMNVTIHACPTPCQAVSPMAQRGR